MKMTHPASGDGDEVGMSFNRSPLSLKTAAEISLSNGSWTFSQYTSTVE